MKPSSSNVNSYKGLIGRTAALEGGTLTWAPTHVCYGYNNRSAMLRLPQTRKRSDAVPTIGGEHSSRRAGLGAGMPDPKWTGVKKGRVS